MSKLPEGAAPSRRDAEANIERWIGELNAIHDGDRAVFELIHAGAAAIEPLRRFLIEGRPSGIYQPRQWAVEALSGLGAKQVLIEYLLREKQIPDPVACFGEETVKSAAALELVKWKTPEVFRALMEMSRRLLLPGVVEALGQFANVEAIPHLDQALEDDMCREAAEEAFLRLGVRAREPLLLSALTPLPGAPEERPSSLRRRRSALSLLAEIGLSGEQWRRLEALLDASDPALVIGVAWLAVVSRAGADQNRLAQRLLEVLPAAAWDLRQDAERCLEELPGVRPLIETEIRRRESLSRQRQRFDPVLPSLRRAAGKLIEKPHHRVDS